VIDIILGDIYGIYQEVKKSDHVIASSVVPVSLPSINSLPDISGGETFFPGTERGMVS
jgi:hypothetical protein